MIREPKSRRARARRLLYVSIFDHASTFQRGFGLRVIADLDALPFRPGDIARSTSGPGWTALIAWSRRERRGP